MSEVQIQSISHRHEAIADWLLAHPNVKSLELLANHMNVSRPWLSVIMNSDVFKEYFEKRRKSWEVGMHERIGVHQLKVLEKAWAKLGDLVEDEDTDPRLVFDVAHKTAERLFGKTSRTLVTEEKTQEISRAVDAGTLGTAREILRRTVTTTKELPLEQLPAPG